MVIQLENMDYGVEKIVERLRLKTEGGTRTGKVTILLSRSDLQIRQIGLGTDGDRVGGCLFE